MGESETSRRKRHIDRIIEQVAAWPNVQTHPRRFGGTEFSLGPREIGHVHPYGIVDVAFPKRVRDALVDEGEVNGHPVQPESGWTTFRLADDADVDDAVGLLCLSYLAHALLLARSEPALLADLDVDARLAELDLSDEVTAVVDQLRPDGA